MFISFFASHLYQLAFFLVEGGFVSKKKKPVVCHSLVLTDIPGRSCKLVPDRVQCTKGGFLLERGFL